MGGNLYGGTVPLMVNSGTFGRCRHGHSHYYPCWRYGLWHPLAWIKHVIIDLSC